MDSMQAKTSREQAAKSVRSWTNIEAPQPGKAYRVGYGGGLVWHLTPQRDKHGKAYAWDCFSQGTATSSYFRVNTLKRASEKLASLTTIAAIGGY